MERLFKEPPKWKVYLYNIQVAVVSGELMIEGSHEEMDDENRRIERHFVRKYTLPKECQIDAIVSHLSRDGMLTVSAPKNSIRNELPRVVPIMLAP